MPTVFSSALCRWAEATVLHLFPSVARALISARNFRSQAAWFLASASASQRSMSATETGSQPLVLVAT